MLHGRWDQVRHQSRNNCYFNAAGKEVDFAGKSGADSNNHWILAKHFNAGDIRKELETLLDVVRVALPHCFNEAGKEVIRA